MEWDCSSIKFRCRKGIDRFNWSFMFEVLQMFGINGSFLQALTSLYSFPSAVICFPHASSHSIQIKNGPRQWCPLSLLLFVLCIEPLAAAIRLNPNIIGVMIRDGSRVQDIFVCWWRSAYAYTSSYNSELLNLHAQLQRFSSLSGYKNQHL